MIHLNISNKWDVIFFFYKKEIPLLTQYLKKINCRQKDINEAKSIMKSLNQGFTYTNFKLKTTIVGISNAINKSEWFNTLIHELKHVQSHICSYYNISEKGEDSAYLIGYLMKNIVKKL